MDIKELKNKSIKELHKLLADNRNRLRELRFKDGAKQLKNVRDIRNLKKEIAQILTLLNNKKNVKDIKVE
ncbi:MAG: 50S ribosomal protein L29 [Patescibacteria group bacterium]|jgi:large subunit ribosomal protein L29